ncbi:HIT-like domain-containing protein [Cyathus striatus]|nr:HIT-like domain-containing protein [Cyathus striatus]
MTYFDPNFHPHRRFNPLTNEYILVSPHRTKRPWLGQTEQPQPAELPQYDPTCYLCPGNIRSGGEQNPPYDKPFTFKNDFPALLSYPTPSPPTPTHSLFEIQPVEGACDVVIFHPRHDLTLARLDVSEIELVLEEWIKIYETRGNQPNIKYVQIFENKGSMMGCSNPHPHCQVWSTSTVPSIPATEMASFIQYSNNVPTKGAPVGPGGRACLLCDYANLEMKEESSQSRIVSFNEHWVALVPWWAIWPFEILMLPYRRHIPSISDLEAVERAAFASILSKITKKYDNLFSCSFAYSMGIHQRPVPGVKRQGEKEDVAHLHLHFTPPLLRSATIRKFLVGFELMAEPQRDLTPEQAAQRLKECSDVHFLDLSDI